jgi:hypothetical protein
MLIFAAYGNKQYKKKFISLWFFACGPVTNYAIQLKFEHILS